MNSAINLFSPNAASQDISSLVLNTAMPLEPSEENSSQLIDLKTLFGSVLDTQLTDEATTRPPHSADLLLNAHALAAEVLALVDNSLTDVPILTSEEPLLAVNLLTDTPALSREA